MKQLIRSVVLVCAFAGVAFAGQEPSTAKPQPATPSAKSQPASPKEKPAGADGAFMQTAAMDGLAEVEHGRLATQNASAADVKQFAQRMVDDHSKAGDELKGLASKKGVSLPTELDQKHRAKHEELAKLKGAAFDKAYMSHMVTAHQQAVALFQKESKGGSDADVKAWAAKTLPTLQEHHKMAQSVNASVGKAAK